MNFWSKKCEDAKPIQPELGSALPGVFSVQDLEDLEGPLPPPLKDLLEDRQCLVLNLLVQWETGSVVNKAINPEEVMLGLVEHKAAHVLHRDNVARFIYPTESRADTVIVSTQAYRAAQDAGLQVFRRYPFLRPAMEAADSLFAEEPETSVLDHSIVLCKAIGLKLLELGLDPREERRILNDYQEAVLHAATPHHVYRHSNRVGSGVGIKPCLIFDKYVPHLKALDPRTDLTGFNSGLYAMNLS